MVANGFGNIWNAFMPDMNTSQQIHSARGTWYKQNKTRTTDTD